MKCALTGLQWTLGVVILIEAVLFLMPSARHDFARTHMPNILRQVLGWGEIIGAVLLLIPRTAVRGGWVLVGIFVLANRRPPAARDVQRWKSGHLHRDSVHSHHQQRRVSVAKRWGTRARHLLEPPMTNQELIHCFENDAIPEAAFHHADHARLAFAYLCEYPVLQGLEKFASALKRFATARGKTQLYNETITCAYFFLIHERMARCEGAGWEEFSRQNTDLLTWKNGILSSYYREGTLKSDLARRVFVFPDKGC
jgi:hypothetical protein